MKLLIAVFLVLACVSQAAPQVQPCFAMVEGHEYDLTPLHVFGDISFKTSKYIYSFRFCDRTDIPECKKSVNANACQRDGKKMAHGLSTWDHDIEWSIYGATGLALHLYGGEGGREVDTIMHCNPEVKGMPEIFNVNEEFPVYQFHMDTIYACPALKPQPCSGTVGTDKFDFSALKQFGDLKFAGPANHTYTFAFCDNSPSKLCNGNACQLAPAARAWIKQPSAPAVANPLSSWYYPILWTSRGDEVQGVKLEMVGGADGREVELWAACDKAATTPVITNVQELPSKLYRYDVKTAAACPLA